MDDCQPPDLEADSTAGAQQGQAADADLRPPSGEGGGADAAPEARASAQEVTLELSEDLSCAICMSLLRDPFVTDCGHTFCYGCISKHLQSKNSCPSCASYLTKDKVHPNFLLHKVTQKAAAAQKGPRNSPGQRLMHAARSEVGSLTLAELNVLLHLMWERKQTLEQQEAEGNLELLLRFLQHSRQEKAKRLAQLQAELDLLESDIRHVSAEQPRSEGSGGHTQSHTHGLAEGPAPTANGSARPQANGHSREGLAEAFGSVQMVDADDGGWAELQPAPGTSVAQAISRQEADQAQHIQRQAVAAQAAHTSQAQLSASGNAPPSRRSHRSVTMHSLPLQPWPSVQMSPAFQDQQIPQQQNTAGEGGSSHAAQGLVTAASGGPSAATAVPAPSLRLPADQAWHDLQRQASQEAGANGVQPGSLPPPPLPTMLSPDSHVHIHPRHMAFQAFQQQQLQRHAFSRSSGSTGETGTRSGASLSDLTYSDVSQPGSAGSEQASTAKRRRVLSQMEDLQQCYLRLRCQLPQQPGTAEDEPELASAGTAVNGDAQPPSPGRKRMREEETSLAAWGGKAAAEDHAAAAAAAAAAATGSAAPPSGCQQGNPPGQSCASQALPGSSHQERGGQRPVQSGDVAAGGAAISDQGLAEFSRVLSVFTQCSRLKMVAQLPRASSRQSSSILSSIEFDRDSQVFATAGVSKRISVYEYANVLRNPHTETHCPALEVNTRSKLSCLSWNKYVQSHLASSDYEGVVNVWDVATSQSVAEYEAHEKRIWSVDSCHTDPMLLVTGSDDGWVKVWSTSQQNSVLDIDMKANVCCVKYNPGCSHEIAVGSADHNVHLYDLRKAQAPLHVFEGHRKAVSYVRYLSAGELVSASTDSTLRMWDVQAHRELRTFSGHMNEKNFVGLSVDGDFTACGSETNEVYVYYKAMSKPMSRRLFSLPGEPPLPSQQDPHQFISAVCWKPRSQVLLAANSQGTIKIFQLTS